MPKKLTRSDSEIRALMDQNTAKLDEQLQESNPLPMRKPKHFRKAKKKVVTDATEGAGSKSDSLDAPLSSIKDAPTINDSSQSEPSKQDHVAHE